MIQDYGFRIYNPTIGKFLSVDPLADKYPWHTPYQFAGNKPIWCIDLDGLEPIPNNNGVITAYKVESGQGPTQIAKDLRENHGMTHITWLDIVYTNYQKFKTKTHVKNFRDKHDPGYKQMNINTGDVLIIPSKEQVATFRKAQDDLDGYDRHASTYENILKYTVDEDAADELWRIFGQGNPFSPDLPAATHVQQNSNVKYGSKKDVENHWLYKFIKSRQVERPSPLLPPIQTMETTTPNGHVTDLPNVGDLSDGKHTVNGRLINEIEKIEFRVSKKGDTTIISSSTRI